ncbi:MAG: DNA repair protein RadC [Candidatus Micrarchaeota archaeon]|nr:DNA repair protein RadC [Candidatus Micrarchaeota archaeon]
MLIKEIPLDERPRERIVRLGPGALSNAELVALVFGNGVNGKSALELGEEAAKNGLSDIARKEVRQLARLRGIGPAKASRLAAAFELGRRAAEEAVDKKSFVRVPGDAAKIVESSLRGLSREHLKVLFLNSRNRLMGEETLFVGSLDSNAFSAREIFKTALDRGAAAIVLAHNHPSGDSSPSDEDVESTKNLALAGKLLGVQVLDHVIIGGDGFYSMKEAGLF